MFRSLWRATSYLDYQMNFMKRNTIAIIVILLLSSCGAVERCPKGDVCIISFINNSGRSLSVGESYIFPDTSLESLDYRAGSVGLKKQYPIGTVSGWKNKINKFCPSGKIMFVVVNNDTVKKYGIDSVEANYLIERRFVLSIDSLEKRNWTITYP